MDEIKVPELMSAADGQLYYSRSPFWVLTSHFYWGPFSTLSPRHLVGGVIPSAAGVGGIMPIRITPSQFVQAVFLSSADLTKVNP